MCPSAFEEEQERIRVFSTGISVVKGAHLLGGGEDISMRSPSGEVRQGEQGRYAIRVATWMLALMMGKRHFKCRW